MKKWGLFKHANCLVLDLNTYSHTHATVALHHQQKQNININRSYDSSRWLPCLEFLRTASARLQGFLSRSDTSILYSLKGTAAKGARGAPPPVLRDLRQIFITVVFWPLYLSRARHHGWYTIKKKKKSTHASERALARGGLNPSSRLFKNFTYFRNFECVARYPTRNDMIKHNTFVCGSTWGASHVWTPSTPSTIL